jgi:hypothetical protein
MFDIVRELDIVVDLIEESASFISSFVSLSYIETEDYVDIEDKEFHASLFNSNRTNLNSLEGKQSVIADHVKKIKSNINRITEIPKLTYERWVIIIEQSSDDVGMNKKHAIEFLNHEIITQGTYDEVTNAIFIYRSFLGYFNECIVLYNQGTFPRLSPLVSINVV